jgi:hypothetical protein
LGDIQKVIFPGYFEGETVRKSAVEYYTGHLLTEIYRKLKPQIEIALRLPFADCAVEDAQSRAEEVCKKLIASIPR